MSFLIASRRSSALTLHKLHGNCLILDLTSKGEGAWLKFSPFYPHGDIPIPFSPQRFAQSVEGIWQALKVFTDAGVDESKLDIKNMKNIKRTVGKFGKVRGHQAGLDSQTLLGYLEARQQIYLPSYLWALENKLQTELAELGELGKTQLVILQDYETNEDIKNLTKPLSHASLVKAYLEEQWPS